MTVAALVALAGLLVPASGTAQVVDSTGFDTLGVTAPDTAAADSLFLGYPGADSLGVVRTLPPEIVGHLESLTTSFFDTPSGMGLIPTGMVEAALASEYVSIAGMDSTNVRQMTGNMTHVLHAIEPQLAGGGLGLGYGFRRAAEGVRTYAEMAASAPGASDALLYHAPFILQAADGAVARAEEAVALARRIRSSTDPDVIRPLLDQLAERVRAMAYGFDADRDGRIGHTPAEAGLAHAAYHLRGWRAWHPRPPCPRASGSPRRSWCRATAGLRQGTDPAGRYSQDTQLLLFFDPRLSSSWIVSGNGEIRWTGPLAMSAVV